ncbi:MAG: long-chain fatty acid--CoA ligase, partial [Gemmatimonadetes bacterium]|nr:long-chain fatty acid--CoA ligase [Gemmatimonadota bacterium]
LVLPETRDPHAIARLVASARVEVLPTSPTFLKLFCLSDAPDHHDLSSLEIVAWGSEAMPASTSERVREVLPHVKLLQKFGTSELGSPRSRTRDAEGLWIDFDGIEHRIVDGTLWLRSETAMLGYLNAPNPFDEEGWWNTGDVVEQDGSWLRILGRRSDLINVGGEKVMPREVEEVLLEMPIIVDAAVRGAPNPLTGQIVEAHVQLAEPLDERELRKAVRAHCRARLAGHKVPARVVISEGPLTTERGKKKRREPEPR